MADEPTGAEAEVVDLCAELIRVDSSNPTSNERAAAELVAGWLAEVGLAPEIYESEPGRSSVVARLAGADQTRPPLLVHGHLDVVPADAGDWQVHPFAGEVRDDCLWGRGAVDMKDMDAMVLAAVRDRIRTGRPPARDLVLAFLADEEAGGRQGSHWLVDRHRHLFADCTEAISEVGGFSLTVGGRRLYLLEAAEKGMAWIRLTARGRAGHGSMINDDNAVTALAEAVARVGRTRFPAHPTATVRALLERVGEALGVDLDPDDPEAVVAKLGPIGRLLGATLRNTANPTMLAAGYKVNVIPQTATAYVDGRFLPGHEADFDRELDEVLGPDIQREDVLRDIALEHPFSGPLVEAMAASLAAEDPEGVPVPYCLSGGTDNKAFARMGITGYGFSPLRLPPELDFSAMFHGVDERVPLEALRFGTRVLDRFFDLA